MNACVSPFIIDWYNSETLQMLQMSHIRQRCFGETFLSFFLDRMATPTRIWVRRLLSTPF